MPSIVQTNQVNNTGSQLLAETKSYTAVIIMLSGVVQGKSPLPQPHSTSEIDFILVQEKLTEKNIFKVANYQILKVSTFCKYLQDQPATNLYTYTLINILYFTLH